MAGGSLIPCIISILILFFACHANANAKDNRKVYIVSCFGDKYATKSGYLSILDQVLERSAAAESLVYSYNTFCGFAAKLTPNEAKTLSRINGVVQVFPSRMIDPLDTTKRQGKAPVESRPILASKNVQILH